MGTKELFDDLLQENKSRARALADLEYVDLGSKVLLMQCVGDRLTDVPRLWGLVAALARRLSIDLDRPDKFAMFVEMGDFYDEMVCLAETARELYRYCRSGEYATGSDVDLIYRDYQIEMMRMLSEFRDALAIWRESLMKSRNTLPHSETLHPLHAWIEKTGSPTGWREQLPWGTTYTE